MSAREIMPYVFVTIGCMTMYCVLVIPTAYIHADAEAGITRLVYEPLDVPDVFIPTTAMEAFMGVTEPGMSILFLKDQYEITEHKSLSYFFKDGKVHMEPFNPLKYGVVIMEGP